jgi:hypothetical protein
MLYHPSFFMANEAREERHRQSKPKNHLPIKPQNPPMDHYFTLLLLSQHYPVSPQLQFLSYNDVSVDPDVAGFLQAAEQQVSQRVLDRISAYAKNRKERRESEE